MSGGSAGAGIGRRRRRSARRSAAAGGDASRRPVGDRVATSAETPTVSHSRLQRRAARPGRCLPRCSTRLRQVVARLRVGDRAREEGVGRVVGVVLVGGEEGRQARFGERHGPGLAEMVDAVRAAAAASSRRIRRAQSSAPERIHADCVRARSAASTWIARHCCQTIEPASVATSATMIIAVSRAAPRWRPRQRDRRWRASAHGAISVSRTRLPARPLPGAKPRTTRTPLGNAGVGAARPAAGRLGAVGSDDVAGRLAVGPGVALEEVDLPLLEAGRARAAGRARCPGTAACAASCPAARASVVTAGPAQRCQTVPLRSSGRSDQTTTCRPPSVRRVRRTLWPSQLSAGTALPVSCSDARSCSHCAITVSRRSVCSSRHLVRLARADDAVDALPGHQRHDRHDDHGDQHLDQREAAAALRAVIAIARGRSTAAGSAGRRRRACARRRGGSSGSASAARPACRRRCGRAGRR